MSRLETTFGRLKAEGGKALITYIMAGDPSLQETEQLVLELERAGGMMIVTRHTSVNIDEWDKCVACDEFPTCYKLSMAKLALETGVMQN